MLWQNLAQYQTWFGPSSYLVHGIQILPVTPVTEHLMDRAFVAGLLNAFGIDPIPQMAWLRPRPYTAFSMHLTCACYLVAHTCCPRLLVVPTCWMAGGELDIFATSCATTPACTTDGWAAFVALDR